MKALDFKTLDTLCHCTQIWVLNWSWHLKRAFNKFVHYFLYQYNISAGFHDGVQCVQKIFLKQLKQHWLSDGRLKVGGGTRPQAKLERRWHTKRAEGSPSFFIQLRGCPLTVRNIILENSAWINNGNKSTVNKGKFMIGFSTNRITSLSK